MAGVPQFAGDADGEAEADGDGLAAAEAVGLVDALAAGLGELVALGEPPQAIEPRRATAAREAKRKDIGADYPC
jgi:hypothetical protein